MTQEQIGQTRVIALYDKWLEIHEGTYAECHRQTLWFGHGGKFNCYYDITAVSDLKYLTSLDWLHPVAMEVMDKLTELFNDTMDGDVFMPVFDLEYNIKRSCYIRPINGEYIDLFNAVYDGIVFLNDNKTANI
jgi:hypothetical protein